MLGFSISWYIFTLTLLELIIKTHPTLHDSSHGFISKNSRYFDDELSGIHEEVAPLRTSHLNDVSLNLPLKFDPTFLDFKQRPLGVPYLEKVTLFNVDKNRTIDMTSISGNTVHFHSSFFEDKKIPPNGKTSFNVVFLGREEGFLESNLFIHTSEGYLKYNVKGDSTFSQYRLRPIVGVKLPLNLTFTPLIYIYNPHTQPLQIVEVFSSSAGFNLELPTGQQEGPNDLWEIPAQQTKAVIRVRFKAQNVQNYTAYIRIKLNEPDEILVIPVEVEVTDAPGVVHPQGYVDFGVGGSLDPPSDVKLCLRNPQKRPIRVHSVSSVSRAVRAQYYNVRLPPAGDGEWEDAGVDCVEVGTLTVDWKTAYETKDFTGKIIVKYRNGKNRSEIPYHLTVLKGGLTFDPLVTTYFMNDKMVDLSSRVFKVKNEFDYTVEVKNITLPPDASYFKIELHTPKIIKPGQEANLFNIKLKNNIRISDLHLYSNIILHTNLSTVLVPLMSYNGKLEVHLPFKSKDYSLDIGLIGFDSRKEAYFMIMNRNPVSLHLKHVHSSIPMTQVEVQGCGGGDHRLVLFQPTFANLTKCHNLKSNHYAVLKVTVTTSHVEGQVWGEIYIETQFENLKVPVHFKIAPGKLEVSPERLVFDQCFPAKICSHPIRIHSTFNDPMVIEDIVTLPPDKRIFNRHTGQIHARTSKVIGHMFLNPDLHCQADCYTGLQTDTSAQWLKTFSLSKFVSDFDLHLVNVFYNRYLNLTHNGTRKWQNITLRLDTSEVRGHIFKSRVKMSWPTLMVEQNAENQTTFSFPLTQVGNTSYLNLTLRNPASYNVVVQLVFDRDYPNFRTLHHGLPPNLRSKSSQGSGFTHGFFFNQSKATQLTFFSEMLGVQADPETLPFLLKPGQLQSFVIGFRPTDTNFQSALLLLRNNLTILETVRLNAQGSSPVFKFGNRKPGSAQFLTFDLSEKYLRECERLRSQKLGGVLTPYLTVKRTFTARNTGDVPMYVHSFHINDYRCEGHGFKVIDCEPFLLAPNSSRKVDIAFTPDFTLSKITRTLILATSLNIPVNYTLYSTITSSFLSACSEVIARPFWEIYLCYFTVGAMLCLLVGIVVIAMIDADRVWCQAMGSFVAPSSPAVQPVLDLRLVGQQIREEIQSTKTVAVAEENVVVCEDVAAPKEHEDDGKKFEMERYTVLVPVTGKTKKKLGKRNSVEPPPNEDILQVRVQEKPEKKKERVCEVKQKTKDKESKVEEKVKKVEETVQKEPEGKKPCFQQKKTKNTIVPVYEEESSSTTTDSSSSNFEDPEKENNQRNTQKNCSKNKCRTVVTETVKPIVLENTNHSTETKPVTFNHNHHHNRIKHQKPQPKPQKTNEKLGNDKEFHHKPNDGLHSQKHYSHTRDKKRERSDRKDRKDKSYHKKSSVDKKLAKEASAAEKQRKTVPSFNIPLPTVTCAPSVWGESRAKFSDVVARSDTTVTSPRTHSTKSVAGKPAMYVEPYKQTPTVELGPIGSQRNDGRSSADGNRRSSEDVFDGFIHSNGLVRDSNSSFFSDEIRLDNTGREHCYLDDLVNPGGVWNHQEGYGSTTAPGMGSDINVNMEDPWNQSLLNSSSYWESYNPLVSDAPLLVESSSQPAASRSAGYLWGSSAVWQPWAPQAPSTPTRTPPGFDEFLQRKKDDSPQPRNSYSPFNTSPLWTQQNQQTSPWGYSQGQ